MAPRGLPLWELPLAESGLTQGRTAPGGQSSPHSGAKARLPASFRTTSKAFSALELSMGLAASQPASPSTQSHIPHLTQVLIPRALLGKPPECNFV